MQTEMTREQKIALDIELEKQKIEQEENEILASYL